MRRAALAAMGAVLALGLVGCGGGSSSGGGSQEAFCARAEQLTSLDQVLTEASDTEKLAAATQAFDELTAAAPADIKEDMATLNEVYRKLADGLKDIDPNNPDAAFAVVFGLIGQFDQQKLEAATTNVMTYANDQCGIDLATPGTDSSVLGGTTTTIDFGGETTTTTAAGAGATSSSSSSTTVAGGTTTTTSTTAPPGSDLPPADPVPGGDDEQLNALAQACHDGDMQACDDLFNQSDFGSEYEDYGNTCGGRVPDNTEFCVDVYP